MAVLKGGTYVAGDFSVAGTSYAGAWSFLATATTSSPGNFFRSTSTPAPTGTTNACYDGHFYVNNLYAVGSVVTNGILFYNSADKHIYIGETAAGTTGRTLYVTAGATTADATARSIGGGNLYLRSGQSVGTSYSNVNIATPTPAGANGTTLNAFATRLTINHLGLAPSNLSSTATAGYINTTKTPTGTAALAWNGYFYATRVYNAVYADIADFIAVEDSVEVEYGRVYCYDKQIHYKSKRYAASGIIGIASDTFGFGVGQKQYGKQIPIAIGGFVLAYCDGELKPGTPLTCGANGTLKKANIFVKLFFPERIIATFYKPELLNKWHDIVVNGRHWVKIR